VQPGTRASTASSSYSFGVSATGLPPTETDRGGEVDRQTADDHRRGGLRGRCSAHHRLDAGQKLDERERLDQIVVGAAAQPLHSRGEVAARGHDDHRHRPVTADLRAQRQPVAVGQPKVEQHEVRWLRAAQLRERPSGAIDAARAIPAIAEGIAQSGGKRIVVLDQQDPQLS
jgi:hypothetical protein